MNGGDQEKTSQQWSNWYPWISETASGWPDLSEEMSSNINDVTDLEHKHIQMKWTLVC